MNDPLNQLMRDRLCTGVQNTDLRELLLHHFKEDGKTPYTFEEQLAKAKAWEAAHNTNIIIMQSSTKTDEQVNYTSQHGQPSQRPVWSGNCGNCSWCAGPRHRRNDCPANRPSTYCSNCGMRGNHFTKACKATRNRYKNKKHSPEFPTKQANAIDCPAYEQGATGGYDDDEYVVHHFTAYAINDASDDTYFSWLPVSVSPNRMVKVLMHVDTGVTCNTLPSSEYKKLACPKPPKIT